MNKLTLRRLLGGMLTLSLAFSALPAAALAAEEDGLCSHHPAHTDDCGYAESGLCTHSCSAENGCVTVTCSHTHDAGCYDRKGHLRCPHKCHKDPACGLEATHCLHTSHEGCGHQEGGTCSFAENGCQDCAVEALIPIRGTDVTLEGHTFPYTGQEIRPRVTVTVSGNTLTEGVHYRLTYENNLAAGTGSVTVTGLEEGGCTGTVTVHFTIEAPEYTLTEITESHVTLEGTEFPFTGEAVEPRVTVTVGGQTLTVGRDYTLTYQNNTRPGTATVTVTGIATASYTQGYTGSVTLEFTLTEKQQDSEDNGDSDVPGDSDRPEEEETPGTDEEAKPVTYRITKGNKSTWYMGSGKVLSFTADGKRSAFKGISVNGKDLTTGDYTVTDNTTVTLRTGYLNKLTAGSYTVTIHFADGAAEGSFTVSNRLDTSNPSTGDGIGIWLFTATGSLAALACAAWMTRRKAL